MISFETAKGIEFLMIFGALFAFGFWQIREVNRLARARRQAEAEAQERGEPPAPASAIPGWAAKR
jgi:cytochrome oxidase assembly protein ShyY1